MNIHNEEQKEKSERALEENDLNQLIETLPVIIWITDPKGYCTFLNKNWYSYTGQSQGEAEGFGWLNVLHPEDKDGVSKKFIKASEEQTDYSVRYRLRTKEGDYHYVIDRGKPRFTESGKFLGLIGTVVDVNEEVNQGKLVKEKEHRTKTIVEEATVATAVYTGPDMKIDLANDAMISLWGKDRSVMGKTLKEALPELEGQPFFQLLHDVYTTGETYWGKEDRVDLEIDGKIQTGYFNFTYKPLRNETGEIYGILNMAIDVSEQWKARKIIEESERRYQQIIHSSPSLIATFEGKENVIKVANDAIIDAWGKGKEVIGKPLFLALPELIDQGFDKIIDYVYETGKPYKAYEMPVDLIRYGKKQTLFYNFVYYPQRDLNGKITGIVDIATEVTPQAELNKKIKESESHFRQMADLMPEKVINTDPEGNVIYFNQHWLDYTGLTGEELNSKGWTGRIHEDDKNLFQEQWQKSLDSGENFDFEIRILNKDGDYRWHLSRAEAVKDEAGKIKLWIGTNTDIQRLKEEEKQKEDFLKVVSHELKTPVTSIKGYVQLLLTMLKVEKDRTVGSLPIQPSLERIDHQITRLTRLISEMLDLTRIEEKKLELQKQVFSMKDLVEQTTQDIHYTNTQHNIKIEQGEEFFVYADKDRIGQVLINLITNAIKYSPESQDVNIRIWKPAEDKVTVSVKDRGIGIDEADHQNIFKRFYRITEEEEDTYSGFGIGLFLANEIIERHNGLMEVKSIKGEGSEFSFTLAVTTKNVNN